MAKTSSLQERGVIELRENVKPTTVNLPKDKRGLLEELAKDYGVSFTAIMVAALEHFYRTRPEITYTVHVSPKANAPTALALELAHNGAVR